MHVSVKVNFHHKDILIWYILIYLPPHVGIKQYTMDRCSYSCIYMHKTMRAAFQWGTKTACYILILCFYIGTVSTEPCKSIQPLSISHVLLPHNLELNWIVWEFASFYRTHLQQSPALCRAHCVPTDRYSSLCWGSSFRVAFGLRAASQMNIKCCPVGEFWYFSHLNSQTFLCRSIT